MWCDAVAALVDLDRPKPGRFLRGGCSAENPTDPKLATVRSRIEDREIRLREFVRNNRQRRPSPALAQFARRSPHAHCKHRVVEMLPESSCLSPASVGETVMRKLYRALARGTQSDERTLGYGAFALGVSLAIVSLFQYIT